MTTGLPGMDAPTPVSRSRVRAVTALLLVYGCWKVLSPFAPAIFFAIAIVVSAWPAHAWLLARLGRRRALASLISCGFVGVVVVVPVVLLFAAFRDSAIWLLAQLDAWSHQPPGELAERARQIPLLGDHIDSWRKALPSDSSALFASTGEPVRAALLATARAFGNGFGQIALAALLLFALFRDGDRIGQQLARFVSDMGGTRAREALGTAHRTLVGVVVGVLGTALAQAVVAIAGLAIAGVPHAFLLGALTFVLSMAPIGPPLVWGGAAIWLAANGHAGWAIFMTVYGVFGISLIDNLIKPFLISRSSRLPFAMTFMGVLGGVLAFGIAGIFVGPALLAVAVDLVRQGSPVEDPAEPAAAR